MYITQVSLHFFFNVQIQVIKTSPGVLSQEQRTFGNSVSSSSLKLKRQAPEDSKQKLMFMFTRYFLSPYMSFSE